MPATKRKAAALESSEMIPVELMDEFPMFQEPMLRLVMAARADPESNWTADQIRLTAGDLLHQDMESEAWNDASILERIDLMLMNGVDPDDSDATAFSERALRFRSMCACPHPTVIDRVISADELVKFIQPLHAVKTFKRWKITDVTALAHALSGVAMIDFGASSQAARDLWLDFNQRWECYLQSHPKLKSLIDLVYVVAILPNGAVAPVWPVVQVTQMVLHLCYQAH